jgi:hypothetical protein
MYLQKLFRSFRWLMALTVISLLASCGGGGDGCSGSSFAFGGLGGEICKNNQTSVPTVSTVISGVTSGGGPIIGRVEITDNLGDIRGTPINADGTYKVDVSGMTGPFIVKAHGTVAGVPVTYYSAGTQEDVGGAINVTPFTDLILSNMAGRAIDSYLSDVNNIARFASTLTPSMIRQTQAALFDMVRPILEQLGVTETVDLMRTVFKTDQSGLNTFLNFVKVKYVPSTSIVELRNLITNAVMASIDVTNPISAVPITQDKFAGISSSTTADLQAIASVLRRIENLFASGLPTLEVLANSELFVPSENFYNLDGINRSFQSFANKIITDEDNIGWLFRGWSLVSFTPGEAATINFKIIYKNKVNDAVEPETLLFRKIGTSWRIVGAS